MSKLLISAGVVLVVSAFILINKTNGNVGLNISKNLPNLVTSQENEGTVTIVQNNKSKVITQLDLSNDRTIFVLGEIGENAVNAAQTIQELNKISYSKPIYIFLDSPGGSVIDGNILVSAIESSKAPVYTICHRICASMAAVIHQYGNKRMMIDRSVLMFHQASAGSKGTIEEMKSMTDFLKNYIEKTERYIANRAGIPYDKYKVMNMENIWIDSEDATAQKFNDEIVNINLSDTVGLTSELKEIKTDGLLKDVQWIMP